MQATIAKNATIIPPAIAAEEAAEKNGKVGRKRKVKEVRNRVREVWIMM
jgi:hypothetical protein